MSSTGPGIPGPDISKATGLVAGITLLQGMSLALVAIRIYSRTIPVSHIWWDDYLIIAAIVFSTLTWIFTCISVSHGLGRHNYFVSPEERGQAAKFLFISQLHYAWALACAKISIALLLIRIWRDNRLWTFFLYGMVIIQVLIGIIVNAFQLLQCKPLSAIWDKTIPNYVCTPVVTQTSLYVTAILTILTDIILSLLPLAFIRHIRRPTRERIAIGFMMGLGLIASCASIYRLTITRTYNVTGDTLFNLARMTFWSIVEIQLAIIAACIPCLKNLFERALNSLGLISSTNSDHNQQGYINHEDILRIPMEELSAIRSTETVAPAKAIRRGSLGPSEEIILRS